MSATQTDLQALLSYLKKRNLVKASADLEARIALAHRSIISIMIWDEQLGSLPNRSKFFLRELKSDAILSLPLAIMGYKKAAMFSLRCLIEDSIRLIYYADHEIEYRLLNHKEKGEMTIDEYFLYITRHPLISDHVERLDLIGKLKPLYAATSSYVHAATRTRMQLS